MSKLHLILFLFSGLFLTVSGYIYYESSRESLVLEYKEAYIGDEFTKYGNRSDSISLKVKCKWISFGTIAPYVTVQWNEREILKATVDGGFDIRRDCEESIKDVQLIQASKTIKIFQRNHPIKELKYILD